MEKNYSADTLNETFNREIVMLLRFLLEGTGHNSVSELEPPVSVDEIADSSHWLKGRVSAHAGEGRFLGSSPRRMALHSRHNEPG